MGSSQAKGIKKYPVFIPPIKKCKVIKVYDGDTITVISKIPWLFRSRTYKFSIRFRGIDAPELRTKNNRAIISKNALAKKILNKKVELVNLGTEKYGRVLCDVYYRGLNLGDWMIKNGYAVEYDGGKKKIFH